MTGLNGGLIRGSPASKDFLIGPKSDQVVVNFLIHHDVILIIFVSMLASRPWERLEHLPFLFFCVTVQLACYLFALALALLFW